MSFTRNRSRLQQFLAMKKYFLASGVLIDLSRRSRLYRIELRGLRNSCAADAKATVLSF